MLYNSVVYADIVIVVMLLLLFFLLFGFTPKMIQTLNAIVNISIKGRQGKSHTKIEKAVHLHRVLQLSQSGLSLNASIASVASIVHSSPTTIRQHFKELLETNDLSEPSTEKRGRGSINHPLHEAVYPSLAVEIFIHEKLQNVKCSNGHESTTSLIAAVAEQFNITLSKNKMLRWLHELGYSHGNKKFMGGLKPEHRFARLRSFIYNYAAALREEKKGNAVIVYSDESYVLQRHCTKNLWFGEKSPTTCEVHGDESGGKRLILIHAMTRDGLLAENNAIASNFLLEESTTCELAFESLSTDGDYHTTVDSEKYLMWIKHRLIPTFNALYPHKKMKLVLDNASYHRCRGSDWYSPNQMSRLQLIDFLNSYKVSTVTVCRDGVEMQLSVPAINSRGGKSTATVSELREAVQKHLKNNPQLNVTEIEKVMNQHQHSLVYTPPFTPEVQPIELLWSRVKSEVAKKAVYNRTIEKTREDVENAFESIDGCSCAKFIQHCPDWLDRFMQTEQAESLKQYNDLKTLIQTEQ